MVSTRRYRHKKGRKAKRQGKKVIYHAHSTEEDFKNSFLFSNQLSPLFKKWISKCYSSADLIVTPTPYAKELLDGYGLGKPVVRALNSVNIGMGFEAGAAIVLLAIVLDRVCKRPERKAGGR